ncbi:hypothetical protein DFH09DRAFT_1326117 [Mycena vulgaris]|nr:hypothetical protein DFH09DRAFT_1326117 [Mycena vulgaris]
MDPAYQDLIFQEILDFEHDTQHRPRLCEGCGDSAAHPLHRIEVLGVNTLKGVTLKGLGLRIQLGHGTAAVCPDPIPDDDFTILDMHGGHEVSLNYCGCHLAPQRGQQLMEARLYPLPWQGQSWIHPHSAVTFEVARCYQERTAERLPRPPVPGVATAKGRASGSTRTKNLAYTTRVASKP